MKRLNNKGYLIVEIIVAATLAISIGYFLVRLTIKFSKQEEDIYYSLYNTGEKNILTKAVMDDIESIGATDFNKNSNNLEINYRNGFKKVIEINDDSIGYDDYIWKLDSNLSIGDITINGNKDKNNCTIDDSYCLIEIPIIDKYSNNTYGVKIFSKIKDNKCIEGTIKENKMYSVNDVVGEYTDNECEMNGKQYTNDDNFKNEFRYDICENGEWVSKTVDANNVEFINKSWFDTKMTMKWSAEIGGHKIYSPEYERTCSREFDFDSENNFVSTITGKYTEDDYKGTENECNSGICQCSNPKDDTLCISKENHMCRLRTEYTRNKDNDNDRETYCGSSYSLKVNGISDVLIVASHATKHLSKSQEQNTGLLCEILAKTTNSSCFSKNFDDDTDPNNSTGYPNNFNNTLHQIISDKKINLVIDLHGCSTCENDFNIAYGESDDGTIDYGNILDGILNDVSKKIKEYNTTVTSFYEGQGLIFNGVKDTGSNAILLEVNDTYLSNDDNYKKFKETLSALIDYVMEVRKKE